MSNLLYTGSYIITFSFERNRSFHFSQKNKPQKEAYFLLS